MKKVKTQKRACNDCGAANKGKLVIVVLNKKRYVCTACYNLFFGVTK